MRDGEVDVSEHGRVSRRKLIKGGMVAGGVAIWAAPVAAAARFNRHTAVRETAVLQHKGAGATAAVQSRGFTAQAVAATCTGYPPGSCINFVCGIVPTQCGPGTGANGRICFCDTDTEGNCRCFNDEFCSKLLNCTTTANCPPGTYCVNPFSCCGRGKCARVC